MSAPELKTENGRPISLRVPCQTRPDTDFCEVFFNVPDGLSIRVRDSTTTSTGFNADADLSEESVRLLFNALGAGRGRNFMNSSRQFLRDWFLITKAEYAAAGGSENPNLSRKLKRDGTWMHFQRRWED